MTRYVLLHSSLTLANVVLGLVAYEAGLAVAHVCAFGAGWSGACLVSAVWQ